MDESAVIYIRVPKYLHEELKEVAERESRTLTGQVIFVLKNWHKNEQLAEVVSTRAGLADALSRPGPLRARPARDRPLPDVPAGARYRRPLVRATDRRTFHRGGLRQ